MHFVKSCIREAFPIKIYKHLDDHIETYFSAILVVFFSILMIIQVIMRYIFNSPLTWSEELSRYAFVWFVYTSASYAVRYQRHVKFSFLVNIAKKITPLAGMFIQFIAFLFWIGFLIFLDIYSVKLVINQYHTQQLSPANQIPMYLIYIGLPLGSFMMTFRLVQHIYKLIQDARSHILKTRTN